MVISVLEEPVAYIYSVKYLSPWSGVLLEKPTVAQPLKQFPAFQGTQRFNTTFARPDHWSLS
jgi:hypothetical protein